MKIILNILKVIWYIIAILIVLLAITVSVLHFVISDLDDHKAYFQSWAEKLIGSPVTIGNIRAHWNGLLPRIDFNQVVLYDKSADNQPTKELLALNHLDVNLNLWRALLAWSFQPTSIRVEGVSLNIQELSQDEWSINGYDFHLPRHLNVSTAQPSDEEVDTILTFLGKQEHLGINNVSINFHGQNQRYHHINFYHFTLLNRGNDHRILGNFQVDQKTPTNADFVVSLKGDLDKIEQANINLYLNLKNLEVDQWWKGSIDQYFVEHGVVSGQVWMHWSKDGMQFSHALIDAHDIQINSVVTHKVIPLHEIKGHVAWKLDSQQSIFMGDKVLFAIGQEHLPATGFYFQLAKSSQLLKIEYIDLASLQRILLSTDLLEKQQNHLLDQLQATGQLTNLVMTHEGSIDNLKDHYKIQMSLNHVSALPVGKLPGVADLSGQLTLSNAHGSFLLNSSSFVLAMPALFDHSINVSQIGGELDWQQNPQTQDWLITGNNIAGVNSDLGFYGQFSLLLPQQELSPRVSSVFGFYEKNPALVKQYIPRVELKSGLSTWLSDAFIAGSPSAGTVVLRGKLSDFPFNNQIGTFIVDASINNLTFEYALGWPVLANLNGDLSFKGNSMLATMTSGKILNATIHTFTASIPEMGAPAGTVLNIQENISSDAQDIFGFVQKSPLKDTMGEGLSLLSAQGAVELKMGLTIPLKNPENTQIIGSADLSKVTFSLPRWNFNFNSLTGHLDFTQQSVLANDIQAQFLGYPAVISLATKKNDQHHALLNINLKSHFNVATLPNYFKLAVPPEVQGESDYQAQINLHLSKQDMTQSQLLINSTLQGLSINLPGSLAKTAVQSVPSSVQVNFGANHPVVGWINYGDNFSSAFLLHDDQGQTSLYNLDLHLGGPGAEIQREAGIVITGALPDFDLAVWQAYFAGNGKSGEGNLPPIRLLDVSFGRLALLGQHFTNMNIKVIPGPTSYDISLDGAEIVGGMIFPKSFPAGTIEAHFKRLYLKADLSNKQKSFSEVDPAKLPGLNLSIHDFHLNNIILQGLVLNISPTKNGLLINKVSLADPLLSFNAQGSWITIKKKTVTKRRVVDSVFQTSLVGDGSTNNLQALLKLWDIKSSFQANTGNARFNLHWIGAPYEAKLVHMSGKMTINLGSGTITDLGSSATNQLMLGKLLTALNFRQIFSGFGAFQHRGYPFDTAHADFILNKGEMLLNNDYFDGPVARVDIKGVVDLLEQTMGLQVTITPYVTSSLPVAAGILTLNPLIGVAAWVANKIVSPGVNAVTKSTYSVTGSWDKPVMKKES
jgi:uncharacterized protein (TIGR02099 family)